MLYKLILFIALFLLLNTISHNYYYSFFTILFNKLYIIKIFLTSYLDKKIYLSIINYFIILFYL